MRFGTCVAALGLLLACAHKPEKVAVHPRADSGNIRSPQSDGCHVNVIDFRDGEPQVTRIEIARTDGGICDATGGLSRGQGL